MLSHRESFPLYLKKGERNRMGNNGSNIIKYLGIGALIGYIYTVANLNYSISFTETVVPSISNVILILIGVYQILCRKKGWFRPFK